MPAAADAPTFVHQSLPCGVEFAADLLPKRHTVALNFRILAGLADDPLDQTGISAIVEQTLSKETRNYSGPRLADAIDRYGSQWSSLCGRQSTLVRVLCLPEFVPQAIDLVCELIAYPTFPADACRVAVELSHQELKQLEDDPDDLVRVMIQLLTLGPVYGRHVIGTPESLARLTPDGVRAHWRKFYSAGRLQVTAAGPLDADAVMRRLDDNLRGFGDSAPLGRHPASVTFQPQREHRQKDLEQEYIALAFPGAARHSPDFAVEQVLIGVLSGGMSARLFTEVREKLGLVYWVSAWHEQPRGCGFVHLGASTTPERCQKTYDTLRNELARLALDVTDEEAARAKNSLIAHTHTEDDLTRARAAGLSDDLFHFGRPIGQEQKLDAVRAVTRARVAAYAERFANPAMCVATLGKKDLQVRELPGP